MVIRTFSSFVRIISYILEIENWNIDTNIEELLCILRAVFPVSNTLIVNKDNIESSDYKSSSGRVLIVTNKLFDELDLASVAYRTVIVYNGKECCR